MQQPGGIHQELAAIGAPGDGIGKGHGPQVGQTPAVAPGGEKDQQAHQQGDAEQAFQDMPAYEALAHRQQGFRCRGQQHGVDGAGIGGADDLVQHRDGVGRRLRRDAQCHGIHGPGGEQDAVFGRFVPERGARIGPDIEIQLAFLKGLAAFLAGGKDLGDVVGIGALVGLAHAAHLFGEAHRALLARGPGLADLAHQGDGRVVEDLAAQDALAAQEGGLGIDVGHDVRCALDQGPQAVIVRILGHEDEADAALPLQHLQEGIEEGGSLGGVHHVLVAAVGHAEDGARAQPAAFGTGEDHGHVRRDIEIAVVQAGKETGMVQQQLAHGLIDLGHDLHVAFAGDEEERVRGDGGHYLGALAAQHAVHIAVDAAFGQGLGHLAAFLEKQGLEAEAVIGSELLHHAVLQ